MGDYNVALNHAIDTLGYIHINNPNSRDYLTRKIIYAIWSTFGDLGTQIAGSTLSTKNKLKTTLEPDLTIFYQARTHPK